MRNEPLTEKQVAYWLTELLENRQNKYSIKTGFGFGFQRWVLSIDLLKWINYNSPHHFSFSELRKVCKHLAEHRLIEIKSRGYGMLQYSTLGWEDCRNINDYFIEDISS